MVDLALKLNDWSDETEGNYAEFTLYHDAAKKGHVTAQYFSGSSYKIGAGVKQNYIEAMKWYKMAGKQGRGVKQS